MAKVAPDNALKNPLKNKQGGVALDSYDATYVQRRRELVEKFFTCKSGRKYCYFTDGSNPAQVQCARA
jgi:hypothetical protein|tara:strand:- start:429 stop:632 length:204 start_codon:yes stop_codon:yes gene_type:complete